MSVLPELDQKNASLNNAYKELEASYSPAADTDGAA